MKLTLSGQFLSRAITAGVLSLGLLAPERPATAQDEPQGGNLKEKVQELIDEVVTAEVELEVPLRRSKILRVKQNIFRAAVADPTIVDFVAFGRREIEFIGKQTGSTTVTLWMGTEDDARLLSMLVTVTRDETPENTMRVEYSELAAKVNELFPNSRIQLIPIADKVIVRGQARDEDEAARIMSVVQQGSGGGGAGGGSGGQRNPFSIGNKAAPTTPNQTDQASRNIQLVNFLHIPGEKQVMLKVRIAELKRSAVRELGTDFDLDIKEFMFESALAAGGNALLSGMFNDASFDLVIRALQRNGNAKILAEPNLVTLSGHPATFLSGGEFAVPTVVGVGGASAATTSFKGFGTSLSFTPTVLDKDRIRMSVSPTFSTLNTSNAVGGVFGLDTRTVQTTVDLREGQVLAIAGLIQEQQRGDKAFLPVIGEWPLLNMLTATRSVSRDETELIVLVTPELVHPMEPDQAPTILPGMELTEPNDLDLFVYGDIEGRSELHHRSTVWPLYKSRLKRCYDRDKKSKSARFFLKGKHGFSK